MQLYNSTKDYGATPQASHWLTVIMVVIAWALGTFGNVLPKGAPGAWMGVSMDPAARIAHYTLYALLVAVPVTGIVLQFARGDARCRCLG